jgi:sulfatase maturation enzyme AslB (radical SAM superfamily)
MLSFVGGEPLFEKKNFDVLEQLISIGNTDCHISLVSNGSIQLTQKQQTILKQFKNLNICLSIDGIEKRFEYIRYPLKWNILIENIDFFKSLDIDLFVSYTISNLNIFYYNETIEWFNQQGLRYNYNIVSFPNYFSLDALPENIKLELKQELFRQHSVDDDANFSRFLIEIQQQDRLKNISIKDYLPEFYELIKESI